MREVWKHEAMDSTPWLQENIDVLKDAFDLNLVNVDRERETGDPASIWSQKTIAVEPNLLRIAMGAAGFSHRKFRLLNI